MYKPNVKGEGKGERRESERKRPCSDTSDPALWSKVTVTARAKAKTSTAPPLKLLNQQIWPDPEPTRGSTPHVHCSHPPPSIIHIPSSLPTARNLQLQYRSVGEHAGSDKPTRQQAGQEDEIERQPSGSLGEIVSGGRRLTFPVH
ncbi:hypothetical protein TWF696_008812 [Orbilia brochopaga]|uniref:Prolactin receptor n=1 Tax=Orbilia brochopaga TaxID=3140254 RepID=A0AAV9UN27_9PEZI